MALRDMVVNPPIEKLGNNLACNLLRLKARRTVKRSIHNCGVRIAYGKD